jgi:hypothetical protein
MIPSLLQIPSAVSDSKLHSVLPNNGKGDFTFDRSTGATRINRDGLIEEVGYFSSELVQNGDFSELGSEIITNGDFASNSDWTLTGATINAGKVNVNSTSPIYIIQNSVATIGKTYRVELTVSDYVSGDLRLRYPFTKSESEFTGNGTYVFYGVAVDARVELQGRFSGQTYDYKIDNVSVKQVDPNNRWTLGTGWSYGTNKAEKTAGTGSILSQSNVVEANKKYKVSFDVVATAGYIDSVFIGGQSEGTNITASGSYSYIFDTTNTDSLGFNANSAFAGSVTNISVVEVQGDRPRLSYDITNGVVEDKPHLLLEPSSTNLVTFSNDYTQTFWTKHQSGTASTPIVTSNYAISPDGTRNADRVIFNLNQATDSSFSQLAASLTTSVGNVTNSVYIKSNTDSNYIMNFTNQTGANNLITVTNEWQRFEVTLNNTGTSSVFRIRLRGTESTSDYADVSIFGAQLEQQSFATSFIPTAGTIISRASETCNNSKPSVNSTEGVLYCEIAALADDGTFRMLSVSDGTNDNRVRINYSSTSEQIQARLVTSGVTQADISKFSAGVLTFHKVAVQFKANEVKLYFDGSLASSDTSASVPSAGTLNVVNFDGGNGTNIFYGKVKGLAVYNEALSESQLMQLTGVTASSIYNNFVTRTASFTVEALNEVKKVIDNL